eukprot:1495713-Rhodomonas_salina.2
MPAARAARPPLPRDSAPTPREAPRATQPHVAGGGGVPLPSLFKLGQQPTRVSTSTTVAAVQRRQDPAPLQRVEPSVRVLARSRTDSTLQWGRAQTLTLLYGRLGPAGLVPRP